MSSLKYFLLMFVLAVAGCDGFEEVSIDVSGPDIAVARTKEMPVVNLPVAMRQKNWPGNRGEYSCAHAATMNALRFQGRDITANRWGATYGNGCNWMQLEAAMTAQNVRYAETLTGDVAFLEWAIATRRGACITVMGGEHMVFLCHLDQKRAAVIDSDPNRTLYWFPREQLIAEWKNSYGWAFTPVYAPAPPLP